MDEKEWKMIEQMYEEKINSLFSLQYRIWKYFLLDFYLNKKQISQ